MAGQCGRRVRSKDECGVRGGSQALQDVGFGIIIDKEFSLHCMNI